MVSQLSARLLIGYSSNSTSGDSSSFDSSSYASSQMTHIHSDSSFANKTSSSSRTSANTTGGSSGYAADQERANPPASINMLSSFRNHLNHNGIQMSSFRTNQKSDDENMRELERDELNFLASVAKDDLKRGGLDIFSPQSVKRSRAFPPASGVDVSSVLLIGSNHLSDTSVLIANRNYTSMEQKRQHDVQVASARYYCFDEPPVVHDYNKQENSELTIYDCSFTVPDMIKSCASLYCANQLEDRNNNVGVFSTYNNDEESSTSSVTAADSDDINNVSIQEVAREPKVAKSQLVSIGEALSMTKNARLIIISTPPFIVVQANAAYHRFSGSSAHILGARLQDVLHNDSLINILKESSDVSNTITVPAQPPKISVERPCQNDDQDLHYSVEISPVGSRVNSVTHFVIELHPVLPSDQNSCGDDENRNDSLQQFNSTQSDQKVQSTSSLSSKNQMVGFNVMG